MSVTLFFLITSVLLSTRCKLFTCRSHKPHTFNDELPMLWRLIHVSDADECELTRFSRECLNGGACVNTVGSFTCTCTEDYTELMCERGKAATTTICVLQLVVGGNTCRGSVLATVVSQNPRFDTYKRCNVPVTRVLTADCLVRQRKFRECLCLQCKTIDFL